MVTDTTPEAARVQLEAIRRLGESRRLLAACEMSDMVRELTRARLKSENPGLDPAGIRDILILEFYGVRRPIA